MFRKLALFSLIVAVALAAPTEDIERRIVGGVDNVVGQVPWAASLRTLAGFHFCTGSLISNWFVVTAAHCVDGRGASSIHLVMGRVTLDGTGGINRQGFRVITHPSFNPTEQLFDVGLVQVSVIIAFTANVQSIFLADTFSGSGLAVKVSGWGSTSQDLGETSNNLRTLDITTLTNAECQSRHTWWNAERITAHHICTNNAEGVGFCQTGAGGSLVWNSQLIGIASWNVPCALGYPDVFVRITAVRTWIISQIGTS